jgi:hypothetical protein
MQEECLGGYPGYTCFDCPHYEYWVLDPDSVENGWQTPCECGPCKESRKAKNPQY